MGKGREENPTYPEVCSGTTGHTEICEIIYDEEKLSLVKVLEHFFALSTRQPSWSGPDRGTQYELVSTIQMRKKRSYSHLCSRSARPIKEIVVEMNLLRVLSCRRISPAISRKDKRAGIVISI